MGGANSKEEEPPVSGVQVTEGLIRQLSSEPQPRAHARSGQAVSPPWMSHLRPPFTSQLPDSSQSRSAEAEQPEDLHEPKNACETAFPSSAPPPPIDEPAFVEQAQEQIQQSVPAAELKPEAVSQQKVNQFADRLVQEYEAPLKALPCLDEKTSCLVCYQQHREDPLRCAQQVAAFTKCAQKASAITVQ